MVTKMKKNSNFSNLSNRNTQSIGNATSLSYYLKRSDSNFLKINSNF